MPAPSASARPCNLGYVDQSRDALDANKTVWEEISGGAEIIKLGKREMNSRAYCRRLQLQGRRPAAEGRQALRRSAQPRPPRQDAEGRRQRSAARRADQRPRHRNAGGARGCAGELRRLRRHHQPRSHVPRPSGDPHPRLRGRRHVEWFEGNFEDYEKDKVRRLGPEALVPHRMTHKRLRW